MLFAVCVVCCVGLVVLRARVAHPLTHVGTVDDGRPSVRKSPPPPLFFVLSVAFVVCVGWCLVVVVCVWVLCGGCCGVVGG